MRRGGLSLSIASSQSWAADYLKRLGVEPHSSSSSSSSGVPPSSKAEDVNECAALTQTLSPSDAAELRKGFHAAQDAFLKGLGVYPFSYATIIGRPAVAKGRRPLRGLSSDDFLFATGVKSQAAAPPPAQPVSSDAPRKISQPSSSPPLRSEAIVPPHWPSLWQLTREIERHTMTRRHLWEGPVVVQSRTNSSTYLITTAPGYAATPALLTRYPFSLLSRVAEHAVRHAWRGGPHVYPKGRTPTHTVAFRFTECPRLSLVDVASEQWNRAEAARLLCAVLRHSCIQADLRQHLWTAAQRYHRDILHDLASLAGKGEGSDEAQWISLRGGQHANATATSVLLNEVKQELFSFPPHMYYTAVPTSENSSSRPTRTKGGVSVLPLRSPHWFHFSSSNSALTRFLAERPHTDVFLSPTPFAQVTQTPARTPVPHRAHTTQEQLWLLLSEMVRLRLVVAYLLHFEVCLFKVRGSLSSPCVSSSKTKGVPDGLEKPVNCDGQDALDAADVDDLFRFLEMQPHAQLQRSYHNRRFLSKYQLRFRTLEGAAGSDDATNLVQEDELCSATASASPSVDIETPRFSTVQQLFTEFSKALEGKGTSTSGGTRGDVDEVAQGRRDGAQCGGLAADKKVVAASGAGRRGNVQAAAHCPPKESEVRLSASDEDFLRSVVSPSRNGTARRRPR